MSLPIPPDGTDWLLTDFFLSPAPNGPEWERVKILLIGLSSPKLCFLFIFVFSSRIIQIFSATLSFALLAPGFSLTSSSDATIGFFVTIFSRTL